MNRKILAVAGLSLLLTLWQVPAFAECLRDEQPQKLKQQLQERQQQQTKLQDNKAQGKVNHQQNQAQWRLKEEMLQRRAHQSHVYLVDDSQDYPLDKLNPDESY